MIVHIRMDRYSDIEDGWVNPIILLNVEGFSHIIHLDPYFNTPKYQVVTPEDLVDDYFVYLKSLVKN